MRLSMGFTGSFSSRLVESARLGDLDFRAFGASPLVFLFFDFLPGLADERRLFDEPLDVLELLDELELDLELAELSELESELLLLFDLGII